MSSIESKALYQTKNYEVVRGIVDDAPNTASIQHKQYIIRNRSDGIVYAYGTALGRAIALTMVAQTELEEAMRAADEEAARETQPPVARGGIVFPDVKV